MCINIESTTKTTESMIAYKVVRAFRLASLIPIDWRSAQDAPGATPTLLGSHSGTGHSIEYPLHRIISVRAPGTYLFYDGERAKTWAQNGGRTNYMPVLLEVTVPRNTRIYRGTCRLSRTTGRCNVLIAQRIRVNKVLEVWENRRWVYEHAA